MVEINATVNVIRLHSIKLWFFLKYVYGKYTYYIKKMKDRLLIYIKTHETKYFAEA